MPLSRAYAGHVIHQRYRPKRHRLKYAVFYLLVDLDELPVLDAGLKLFGYNRFAPFAFYDRDHGARDGTLVRRWVDTQLAHSGIDVAGGRVMLLCLPRMFGYAFNPLSVYFCYDRADRLHALLYEVRNTFGQSHTYVVPVDDDDGPVQRHRFKKAFYVSPFIPMDCSYDMTIIAPRDSVGVTIAEADSDGALLAATFRGDVRALSDRFLAAALLRYPLMTLKVIAGIHWEALKLWRKRIPLVARPAAPRHAVSLVAPANERLHGRSNTPRSAS